VSSKTIWKVQPIDASFHPGILVRCPLCNANGTQNAPDEKRFDGRKLVRGTVALGMQWARDFRLVHHPTCPSLAVQYAAVESAEKELNVPKHQIYLLEQAVEQAQRELDRAYISKLPSKELSQIEQKLEFARTQLGYGHQQLTTIIAALEREVGAAQTALETARAESAPESTLAEFEKAMARYLPKTDTTEPVPPGQQRINGHIVDVF